MSHSNLSQPLYEPAVAFEAYPETEEGWRELYEWRWQQYLMGPYSATDQKNEHLFRAFDDGGDEVDQTRRLFRYYGFVTDVDARALHGGGLTLETLDHKPGTAKSTILEAGERVWTRSRLNGIHLPRWSRMLCGLGDYWVVPICRSATEPRRTTLVGFDPRCVTPTYDETGTFLERVEIDLSLLPGPLESRTGPMGAIKRYKRILTADRIDCTLDGKPVPEHSGPHPLGVVPAVHLQALAWDQPEHSLPAPFGVERALMRLDSLMTQAGAIGNRYGNPTLACIGFKVGTSSNVSRFGRIVSNIPAGGDLKYVEAGATAIVNLLQWAKELIAHVREVTPELVYASDSAQESAASRSLRGQAFEAKMLEMRSGVYAGLADVTAMAVALDENRAIDTDTIPYTIDAPPVLPRSVGSDLDNLLKIERKITPEDFTRHLQRLGLVGNDREVVAYTAEVEDRFAARAMGHFEEEDADEPTEAGAPAPIAAGAPTINLTSTDIASIVTVDEARASQGLPPLGGPEGKLTVAEYQARNAAVIAAAANATSGEAAGGPAKP